MKVSYITNVFKVELRKNIFGDLFLFINIKERLELKIDNLKETSRDPPQMV